MASRTLVDVTAVPHDRGGVGRYVDALVAELGGDLVIACQARDEAHYRSLAPGATVLPQAGIESAFSRLLWEQLRLPGIVRRTTATVLHSPHYTVPVASRAARVVTFHDATFFSHPAMHTPVKRFFFSAWIRLSLRLAREVIVPSHATAAELARYTHAPIGRFTVVHHGVDHTLFRPPTAAELTAARRSLDLDDQAWIAFLGTIEPRKNVPALIRAYRMLASAAKARNEGVPVLAIAGGRGWETKLDEELALVVPPGEVRELGFLDLEVLAPFLGGAMLVVYPSSGEGFGLPVLEAMASGAAVLTTRELALPEVGGDAVAYCEPTDSSIAQAMESLLGDDALRRKLAAAGAERSREFSWERAARLHEQAYERAAGGGGDGS